MDISEKEQPTAPENTDKIQEGDQNKQTDSALHENTSAGDEQDNNSVLADEFIPEGTVETEEPAAEKEIPEQEKIQQELDEETKSYLNQILQDPNNHKGLIEAILFLETDPISYKKLADLLNLELKVVKQIISDLANEYQERNSGLQINDISNEIRLSTNQKYGDFLRNYYKAKHKPKFSRSSLETLAIIAYKQPITRGEIEDIRGVSCDNAVRDLLEKKLIKIVGRKKVPGNPIQYGTSKDFLSFFGLKKINDLPTLKEIKELNFE